MSLYKDIQKYRLTHKKAGNTRGADILTTIMSEIQRKVKPEDATNEVVRDVCKKMLKDVNDLISVTTDEDRKTDLMEEVRVLELFLPKQLTKEELEKWIQIEIDEGADNIGTIMKGLKKDFAGQYDGKLASIIAREKLQ